ncbi:hypothetical protein EV361DRAFT_887542 [Lentinula raphanica]|nr:hypothetical protein EV361DRAFT_887542 [Lentinula raphanica]
MAPKRHSTTAQEPSASDTAKTSTPSTSTQPPLQSQTSAPGVNTTKTRPLQPLKNSQEPSSSTNKPPSLTPSKNDTIPEPALAQSDVTSSVVKERPLAEVISEKFAPFDHNRLVVGPFTEETNRDANFEQELGTLLLDIMLETHAWAAARPRFESQLAMQRLENRISDVMEVESTQGMSLSSSNVFHSLSLWFALLFGRAFVPDVLVPILTLHSTDRVV